MAFSYYFVSLSIVNFVIFYHFRNYNNSPACRSSTQIDGKVVIVTGPNTGIGKETVVDLAKKGLYSPLRVYAIWLDELVAPSLLHSIHPAKQARSQVWIWGGVLSGIKWTLKRAFLKKGGLFSMLFGEQVDIFA